MINSVILVGRIASIYKENSKATFITLAVTDKYDKTEFIPCVAFGHLSKWLNKYFNKGKWLAIKGRISVLEDGQSKRINVVIEEASFTGDKKLEAHSVEVNAENKTITETLETTDNFTQFESEGNLPWEI